MYVVLAILVFGLLIIVHELGHFLVAKAVGVRVNQFSLGLGPRLFGKKIGETDFCVCALPIGGACVMEGEDEASDDDRAFVNKPVWARFLILVAGSAMNFLMGLVILSIIVMPLTVTDNVIEGFPEALEGTNGGLLAGDEILKIDGERVIDPGRIAYLLSRSGSNTHEIVVRRNGEKLTLENAEIIPRDFGDGVGLRYGINLRVKEGGIFTKLGYAVRLSAENVRIIRMSLVDLVTGSVKMTEMSGPVGITAVMSEAAKTYSVGALFELGAFIAINLAVMNMLPLPALDGGRVLFLAVELLLMPFGKKLDPKYENYVHLAGLVLFLALMVFVTYNDIVRLIKG